MRPRSLRNFAWEPSAGRVSIALVGMEERECVCLPQALLTLDTPRVITYAIPKVFLANPPAWWIDLLVLSHAGGAESLTRMLAWARRRWPGALQAVITCRSEDGERAARKQGAMVLMPPLGKDDWEGLLKGAEQVNTSLAGKSAF